MWHVSQTSSRLLKCFLPLTVGSCLWWKFLIWLSLNMFSYIFLGSQLLQATPWSCFAWSREYLKLSRISIYLSMAFNSYPLPYAYVLWIWSWIYLCNPPPRNISIHYLSWQVIIIFVVNILIIFTLALALNCLIWLPRICFDLTLICLPCIFWILYCSTWNLFCAFLSWEKQWTNSCALTFKSHTSW